jgi:plastocyanin
MRRTAAILLAVAAIAAALLAVATSGAATISRAAGTKVVELTGSNRFRPARVTIRRGSTVRWVWAGGFHNVTGRGFASKTTSSRRYSFRHRFRHRGTFRIVCTVHESSGMKMKVRVIG